MAEIAPLRGIIYNKEKCGDMSKIVAPPYDVVTPEQQAAYHNSHPNNIMRIDLGAKQPEDRNPYDWHVRAAYEFNRWLADGVLIRHKQPAIYLTATDFTDPTTGLKRTRHGFACLLRLEEFGTSSKIRPHERTFSEHRAERLNHMKHVQANLSQVFAVFPDEKEETHSILEAGRQTEPLFDFTDTTGKGHRLWPVWDQEIIRSLGEVMKEKTVYIADGHHRYETGLAYRRLKAESGVAIGPNSPLNYLLVYLCAISDPGLAILPAHRLMSKVLKLNQEDMEAALGKFFEVTPFSFNTVDRTAKKQAFLDEMKTQGENGTVLGLYTKLSHTYYLLRMRKNRAPAPTLEALPALLQRLDTVVLTSLLFQEVFGMTEDDLDDVSRIAYSSIADEAIDHIDQGKAELAAIHNPTRIEQVQDAAEAGLVMPRKSTYFFPKVITGLTMNPINPFEEITSAC